MSYVKEQSVWEPGVYQLETSDPVQGGENGISNRQAQQLANRAVYLKGQQEKSNVGFQEHLNADNPHKNSAPLNSPELTGTPTAPTASAGTNSTQLATTAFVRTAITSIIDSAPAALDTLNELAAALGDDANFAATVNRNLSLKANIASPAFSGTPTAPTPAVATNSTQLATTAFVQLVKNSVVAGAPANASNLKLVSDLINQKADITSVPIVVSSPPTARITNNAVIFSTNLLSLMCWQTIGSFSGYARPDIGEVYGSSAKLKRPYELDCIGGVFNKASYPGLWAWAQAQGYVVTPANWKVKVINFADLNATQFRLPDLRDVFFRMTGTDSDNANARALGSYQSDAMQKVTGYLLDIAAGTNGNSTGVYKKTRDAGLVYAATQVASGNIKFMDVLFDLSASVRTSTETRSMNTALRPVIVGF